MLGHLKIVNFRCLRDVDVQLHPLTVLIGANDTGKSAFLDAVFLLADPSSRFRLQDRWRHDAAVRVSLKANDPVDQQFMERSSDRDNPPIGAVYFFSPVQRYRLPSTGVVTECEGWQEDRKDFGLGESGSQVPALLDHFLRRDRRRFDAVVKAMQNLVPGFEDIFVETPNPNTRRIDFVIENGLRITGDQASAGVRLTLFFVALAHHPSPPKVILLEEPEIGFHPHRLQEVMNLLRDVTQGKHGGAPAQVILTTHSPYLLDYVDIRRKEEGVLVFRRNPDGSRTAQPANAERLKTFLDEFRLGEVWFNEQEEGLVAKA